MLGDSERDPHIDYFGTLTFGSQLQLMVIHLGRKQERLKGGSC